MIYPLPAVLVSCGSTPEEYNILTIAWTGTICTNPPMCYISVRPERHSYDIIKRNMEFVINLTTKDMARATDWCGVRSGKDYNKFEEMHLTPGKSTVVSAPLIKESPLCIECRVKEIMALGSHDMFIADVVNVRADTRNLNPETGKLELAETNPLVYVHGGYYELGEKIGKFGWSVEKRSNNAIKVLRDGAATNLDGFISAGLPRHDVGTDSGCARYCRRRAFRTPQGNSGQFRFQRRFHLFLVPCVPVQRQRSAHRRSAEQLQDRIFRLPFHADKLRPPLSATGNILQHQPVQHHLRETSARRRRTRSPAGGSLHYIVHPQYRHPPSSTDTTSSRRDRTALPSLADPKCAIYGTGKATSTSRISTR